MFCMLKNLRPIEVVIKGWLPLVVTGFIDLELGRLVSKFESDLS